MDAHMREFRAIGFLAGLLTFLPLTYSTEVPAVDTTPTLPLDTGGIPGQAPFEAPGLLPTMAPAPVQLFPAYSWLGAASADDGDDASGWQHPRFLQDLVDEDHPPASPYQINFTSRLFVGPIRGYAQIAKNSLPHTSSIERPHFDDLGITQAVIPDIEASVSRGPHEIYAGAQFVRLDGVEKIKKIFTSQGNSYTPGSRTYSSIDLDWYRLGYRYSIPLFIRDDGIARLTIVPQGDVVYWANNDSIRHRVAHTATATDQSTTADTQVIRRTFEKATVRLGAGAEWRPYGGPLSIKGLLIASPPISGLVFVASEELDVKYRLFETPHFGMTASVGLVFEQMNYRDSGTLANHIHAELGPMFVTGLEMRF